MSEIVNASAVRFDSLSATGDGYTLLSINGKVCKSDKLLSEMVQSAVDSEHFATEQWVNEQGFIKEETDWTETIKEASANAVDSAIDWVEDQGYLTEHQSISADEWNSCYETVSANSATWMTETDWTDDINAASAYALDEAKTWVENQNYITGVDLSNYYQKTETSGASEISDALDLKEDKIFVAVYNNNEKTSFADIKAAYDAGKKIYLKLDNFNEDNPGVGWSPYKYIVPLNNFYTIPGGSAPTGVDYYIPTYWFQFDFLNDGNPHKLIIVKINDNDSWSTQVMLLNPDLTDYYTKSETSAASAISGALDLKEDKLTFAGENNTITAINSSAIGGEASTYNNGYLIDIDSNNNINIRNNNCVANTANYAYALGNSNSATGSESLAVGFGNKATQNWAVAIGKDNNAFGTYGVALGNNTSAGNYSLTFGQQNSAVEYSIAGGLGNSARTYAIAFGSNNMVTGDQAGVAIGFANSSYNAFAYGKLNNVNGPSTGFAAAFGISNSVTKDLSFAFGNANTANHSLTFMFGTRCITNGTNAVALGSDCIANGNNSFACGNLTKANKNNSHAEGAYTIANGYYSHSEGFSTIANNDNSHAEGEYTSAFGVCSHTEGNCNLAEGNWSHAEGGSTVAKGENSHSEGFKTSAIGSFTHAEGRETFASGNNAHAEGHKTITSGLGAHAEGYETSAGDYNAAWKNAEHAEGYQTKAIGRGSHAEGSQTIASANGGQCHAEGYMTIALGDHSHAEGASTTANGTNSHAEGQYTLAIGIQSHAEGKDTIANGECSHAEGIGTIANDAGMHVQGKYNKTFANAAFVIGNGTKDNDIVTHSDAFVVDWNGNVSATRFATSGIADLEAKILELENIIATFSARWVLTNQPEQNNG